MPGGTRLGGGASKLGGGLSKVGGGPGGMRPGIPGGGTEKSMIFFGSFRVSLVMTEIVAGESTA